ncbi:hypothetical protein ACWDO6_02345 [Streptomyces sp. NPDC003674]
MSRSEGVNEWPETENTFRFRDSYIFPGYLNAATQRCWLFVSGQKKRPKVPQHGGSQVFAGFVKSTI